jgi:hypothetical protein
VTADIAKAVDARLRRIQIAGEQLRLDAWFFSYPGALERAHAWATLRHPSFRVHRMCDGSLLLTKRACISRNRWL